MQSYVKFKALSMPEGENLIKPALMLFIAAYFLPCHSKTIYSFTHCDQLFIGGVKLFREAAWRTSLNELEH